MVDDTLRDRLLASSRGAVSRQAPADEALSRAAFEPAAVGDIFLLHPTDGEGYDGEWVLLARREGDRFLTVPADSAPMVGPGDLEVAEAISGRALVLRCGAQVTLSRAQLGRRSGRLSHDSVASALRTLDAVQTHESGGFLAEDTALDPEYQDLIDQLEVVRRNLSGALEPPAAEQKATAPSSVGAFQRFLPLAATAVLTLGLTLLGGGLWHRQAIFDLEQKLQATSRPMVGLPLVWIDAKAEQRSTTETVTLESDAGFVLLILQAPEPSTHYLLELIEAESGSEACGPPIWTSRAESGHLGELTLMLPTELLSTDNYRLVLHNPLQKQEPWIFELTVQR